MSPGVRAAFEQQVIGEWQCLPPAMRVPRSSHRIIATVQASYLRLAVGAGGTGNIAGYGKAALRARRFCRTPSTRNCAGRVSRGYPAFDLGLARSARLLGTKDHVFRRRYQDAQAKDPTTDSQTCLSPALQTSETIILTTNEQTKRRAVGCAVGCTPKTGEILANTGV